MSVTPHRAVVTPRVLEKGSDVPMHLERRVRALLELGAAGFVQVGGGPGAGKSTALAQLAFVFGDERRLVILDEPAAETLLEAPRGHLVVYVTVDDDPEALWARLPLAPMPHLAYLRLAPWNDDDLIEYLLAVHKDRCRSVMTRLQVAADRAFVRGIPLLWVPVLERFAADENATSVVAALREHLAALLERRNERRLAERVALTRFVAGPDDIEPRVGRAAKRLLPIIDRFTRCVPAQLLLGADRVVEDLAAQRRCRSLEGIPPRALIEVVADRVRERPDIRAYLAELFESPDRHMQPSAASLLLAVDRAWRPTMRGQVLLSHAHLDGAEWSGVRLNGARLNGASFVRADLSKATLDRCVCHFANFARGDLHGASLERGRFSSAKLSGANLSFTRGESVRFLWAELEGANLRHAHLPRARFDSADLRRARFDHADLSGAYFSAAKLGETSFAHANLEGAELCQLDLRTAVLNGASLRGARLDFCNLEFVRIAGANLENASLENALLSGSWMPGANFDGASLRGAGLADIEWERADLRNADLTHAAFHLGSSRSGLVQSPLACEGSRTGFYTDEYDERTYRAPEDIRKANLRGADLRGAWVVDTDFYLVDLRDALYDDEQREHFRRCGAILESRV